jgi:hypothetical protein
VPASIPVILEEGSPLARFTRLPPAQPAFLSVRQVGRCASARELGRGPSNGSAMSTATCRAPAPSAVLLGPSKGRGPAAFSTLP